ncbi:MAG: helix-turn-helix transcriptional regulator [Bacteroidales bacterium]|nr:helix-turn-helix transcriptional regulator [Bacteroidales bacterium]MBK7174445.1 helix-turn-helix transcriptional regulator [Bacteroidales bacterium]
MIKQNGSAVIINASPIIQQGLKNILLAKNIGISDIVASVPDYAVLKEWKHLLLIIDTKYTDELERYAKLLRTNGNYMVGIGTMELKYYFDEFIDIYESTESIIQKINDYVTKISDIKSDNQLSAREIEVLTMVAQGLSNKQIADKLFISIHTAITHRKNITFKLGIKSISGLTLYAALNNMVDFH